WNRAKHQSHPDYNLQIQNKLVEIFEGFNNMTKQEKEFVKEEFFNFIIEQKTILHTLTSDQIIRVLK
ncbi:MAG: hypothetical protein AB7E26_04855, partial [Chryseobacterium sp.]